MTTEFKSDSPEDTGRLAGKLAKELPAHSVILLSGELGAGKTAFVSAFVKSLGLTDRVNSPTFSIMNEYWNPDYSIYHFDLYRVGSPEEIEELGLLDFISSADYAFVEWPEVAEEFFDFPVLRVEIRFGEEENERIFSVSYPETAH